MSMPISPRKMPRRAVLRRRQPAQAQDEEDRRDEVREADERGVHGVRRLRLRRLAGRPFLNMRSMRSVIMNPPTTLMVAAVTAMKPRTARAEPWCAPAATSEPTSEMPQMALVPLMSGVCSSGGTREMTW